MVCSESAVVIRDCAVDDYGDFCQEFEPQLTAAAAAAVSSEQQDTKKHEICVNTCHRSMCNKQPVANDGHVN